MNDDISTIFISAGEPSGDIHAAELVLSLKNLGRALGVGDVKFRGQVRPYHKKIVYNVSVKKLITRSKSMIWADAEMQADDKKIYTAKNLHWIKNGEPLSMIQMLGAMMLLSSVTLLTAGIFSKKPIASSTSMPKTSDIDFPLLHKSALICNFYIRT